MPAFLTRTLIGAVNPRLALYTNAGLLALIILIVNYLSVGALAVIIMQSCSTIVTSDTSYPTTTGGEFQDYEGLTGVHTKWMVHMTGTEGTTSSGGVTTTTEVDYCVLDTYSVATAPWPSTSFVRASTSLGGLGLSPPDPEPFSGTNLAFEMPCWSDWIQCFPGETFDGDYSSISATNMPCKPVGQHDADAAAGYISPKFAKALKKQKWCSAETRASTRDKVLSMRSVPSDLYAGQTLDFWNDCGGHWFMAPGGVLGSLYAGSRIYPDIPGVPKGAVHAMYTNHWNLTVTTTVERCPTFTAAFGNAFAFATQIEVAVTLALILAFKNIGIIKPHNEATKASDVVKAPTQAL